MMYHTPNIGLTALQAGALGIRQVGKETAGEPEKELEDLKQALSSIKTDAVVSGAILSDYQKTRVESTCHGLGLPTFSPLWRVDQVRVLNELCGAGFRTLITAVASSELDESWLGRELNPETIRGLSSKFNPAGEGGEIETFVYDGPIFKKPIKIKKTEKVWEGNSGYLRITI